MKHEHYIKSTQNSYEIKHSILASFNHYHIHIKTVQFALLEIKTILFLHQSKHSFKEQYDKKYRKYICMDYHFFFYQTSIKREKHCIMKKFHKNKLYFDAFL